MERVMSKSITVLCAAWILVGLIGFSCTTQEAESENRETTGRVHPSVPEDPTREMVFIPGGRFWMGSNDEDKDGIGAEFGTVKPLYRDEHPLHPVTVDDFWIDKYEVTNIHYKQFVTQTQSRPPKSWPNGGLPIHLAHYPVTAVNWYEAKRFCEWAGKRLPTEAEWEKAARGSDARRFPWGNEFDATKANTGESPRKSLAPVGSFETGKSPYGVYDMTGNVWEWTADWYQPYPGSTYESDAFGRKYKVLKGGSWGGAGHYALPIFYRIPYRLYASPEESYPDGGFRCAKDP